MDLPLGSLQLLLWFITLTSTPMTNSFAQGCCMSCCPTCCSQQEVTTEITMAKATMYPPGEDCDDYDLAAEATNNQCDSTAAEKGRESGQSSKGGGGKGGGGQGGGGKRGGGQGSNNGMKGTASFGDPGTLQAVQTVATGAFVKSQVIETIPPKLYVKTLSKDVILLCRSKKPASFCSVKIPGISGVYAITNLPAGVEYYGHGLQSGECGISFITIKSENEGKFQCNMTIGGKVFTESIEVVIAVAPEPTDIEVDENVIVVEDAFLPDQNLKVQCTSKDGVPAANLTWWLDDEQIYDWMTEPVKLIDRVDEKGKKFTTVTQVLNYFITGSWEHGRKIICRAEHLAINKGYYQAFLPVNIRFPPEPLPTIYIGGGEHTVVNITIRANPRPTTSWKINEITVTEGESAGPYEARFPRDLGFGKHLVELSINEPTEYAKIFLMTATNKLGSREYEMKAEKSPK